MPGDYPPGAKNDAIPESSLIQQARRELTEILKQPLDMEWVEFISFHIDNPCGFETSEGVKHNIRDFYLREAAAILPKLTNPFAKEILERKIAEYKK